MEENIEFNSHNKEEYAPAHTAEHLLNQTMIRMFGCGRSVEAHIEKKKSKMDFKLTAAPTETEIKAIEQQMNDVIKQDLPITYEYTTQTEKQGEYDLGRLPENATEQIRIVKIGDYDSCPCIGKHVSSTSEIGEFKIISSSFTDGIWRVRWKTIEK